jgi:hypothetical protein
MAKRERKEERTNNNLQNTTQEAKDRALKIGVELRPVPRKVRSSCSTSDTHRVTLVTKPMISNESGTDREVLR